MNNIILIQDDGSISLSGEIYEMWAGFDDESDVDETIMLDEEYMIDEDAGVEEFFAYLLGIDHELIDVEQGFEITPNGNIITSGFSEE